MILLRPMSEEEYPAYLAYFIPDYATEIAANYGLSSADALAQAKREIAEDLPAGVNTPGQVLLSLFLQSGSDEKPVGYLWYKPDFASRTAFIYDFHIVASCQGKGLGKRALAALENELREKNIAQLRLRVAGDNSRARHVYETTGFRITGVNMSKNL